MTRDWKTGKTMTNPHRRWRDPILDDAFGITEEDWKTTIEQTVAHVRNYSDQSIAGRVSCIIDLLLPPLYTLWQGKNGKHPFRWLPCNSLEGATVADHSLTASAIAYCLGYDDDDIRADDEKLNILRLSAMTATWIDDGFGEVHDILWDGHAQIVPKSDGNDLERIVYLAMTAASERNCPEKVDFNQHPLKDEKRQVGLVLGGATKIKGYFMESAKLPEIRGASALLDRINLEDVPSLFGRRTHEQDPQRAERFRKDFYERTGHNLSAPECIIYAAGGNTLAFTPTSAVQHIADEIERIYTQETLVANSAAVGDTFNLLELQYGLNPTQFWINNFQEACEKDETQEIMHTYYGKKKDDFLKRKCFGELTSKLAGAQMKRREGNITPDRETRRDLPTHVEVGPYQQRCESCERRPALFREPRRQLCEACARKYITGRATKKPQTDHPLKNYTERLKWSPAYEGEDEKYLLKDWITIYNEYTKSGDKLDGPNDLADIAAASDKENYIAFIYADGNNMGAYLENIASPSQYRQFSERVFVAMQKAAFDALANHLTPTKDNVHPFEIVSIGGDDLLLIVPGSNAFEIVHEIGTNFDNQFNSLAKFKGIEKEKLCQSQRYQASDWSDKQKMQPVFSMSLGFVIAEEHTPVAFLEHLAASLLKSAKNKAKTLIKDDVGYRGGTVDLLVLKSISMITSNLSDFRKSFYKTDEQNVLTMRPYTLHELSGFTSTVKDLKKGNFPRSQLYQLRESIKLGRATSTLDYLYFRSRLDQEHGERLRKQIEKNWHGVELNNNLGPWYQKSKDDTEYETLLLDIIEAYEFIPKPENNTEDNDIDSTNNRQTLENHSNN